MQAYRNANGIVDQPWNGGNNAKAANNVDVLENSHDKEQDLQALEAKSGWRQLCNIEVHNKYAALSSSLDAHDTDVYIGKATLADFVVDKMPKRPK